VKSFFVEIKIIDLPEETSTLQLGCLPKSLMEKSPYTSLVSPWMRGCTFPHTEKEFPIQDFYHCDTCWPQDDDLGVCTACAEMCHAGHSLIYRGSTCCYCDCPDRDDKCECFQPVLTDGLFCGFGQKPKKVQFQKNETVGVFIDLQNSVIFFTKEQSCVHVTRDLNHNTDLVPVIIANGQLVFEYNLGPHQDKGSKTIFPLLKFCKSNRLTFPKFPSLSLSIFSTTFWTMSEIKKVPKPTPTQPLHPPIILW
jgi:hypothetical protein